MPNFRRYYLPNSIVFITCVTDQRFPYLKNKADIDIFLDTLRRVQTIHPFHLLAYVVLPDHFHSLMQVMDPSHNFSKILHSVKRNFTLNYKQAHRLFEHMAIWQSRFWDHVIRNEEDLEKHFDYIHWNPVKHGYVRLPEEWEFSTHKHWMEKGYYPEGWGANQEPECIVGINFE